MNEVALVTREEKLAIVGAIDAQFKAQLCTGLTQYEPLDAQDYLIGTGEFDELEITVKRQFVVYGWLKIRYTVENKMNKTSLWEE